MSASAPSLRFVRFLLLLVLAGAPGCNRREPPPVDADTVVPGVLLVEAATPQALGFEWPIAGDVNRNAVVTVRYRRADVPDEAADEAWQEGLPLLRVDGEQAGTPELDYEAPRLFAGSLFDLEPGVEYRCRFEIRDPDGVDGEPVREVSVRTRTIPAHSADGEVRHVYPADWTGPRQEPAYDGLLHAYYGFRRFADWDLTTDRVGAGDQIVVHAGTYRADRFDYRDYHGLTFHGAYVLTADGTSDAPIVIRAAGDGEVVFDGAGAYRLFDVTAADHHHFEGLTLRNAEIAILAGVKNAYGSDGLVVRRCRIEDVGIGIMGEYEASTHFYIADNVILGRENPDRLVKSVVLPDGSTQQRFRSYYGVKVYGQGHVVTHNRVAYFFDGIDINTHGRPGPSAAARAVSIDITNNDVFHVNDNCIEADGAVHNVRILRNRCVNSAQAAFSNQPVMGGPVYWIRNVSYNSPGTPAMKFWGMRPAGVVLYHNTFTTYLARPDKGVSNLHARNNLFLPPDEETHAALALQTYTSYSSLDYNGYRFVEGAAPISWHAPADTVLRDYALAHPPQTFESLDAFRRATGQEQHGIEVDYDSFLDLSPPRYTPPAFRAPSDEDAFPSYPVEGLDFSLRPESPAVDAGVVLPGVNDDFTGRAPDLGALERDRPVPHYGPRTPDAAQ